MTETEHRVIAGNKIVKGDVVKQSLPETQSIGAVEKATEHRGASAPAHKNGINVIKCKKINQHYLTDEALKESRADGRWIPMREVVRVANSLTWPLFVKYEVVRTHARRIAKSLPAYGNVRVTAFIKRAHQIKCDVRVTRRPTMTVCNDEQAPDDKMATPKTSRSQADTHGQDRDRIEIPLPVYARQ